MSRLNANLFANETRSVLNNKKALISVSLATAISLSSGLIEINFLPIYGFERIAIYFGLLGLFAHLFSFNYQITSLKIDLLYWLKLIMCFAIVCFLINRYIGSFSLSDNRIIGFITLILPITLVSLVIEKLIASSSIWTAILLRGLPIIGFSMLLRFIPRTIRLNVHYRSHLYPLLYCFWLHWETSEKENWACKGWSSPWNIPIVCFCSYKSNFCPVKQTDKKMPKGLNRLGQLFRWRLFLREKQYLLND